MNTKVKYLFLSLFLGCLLGSCARRYRVCPTYAEQEKPPVTQPIKTSDALATKS